MMSKKDYSTPDMKVMQMCSEERFTAVCGTTYQTVDYEIVFKPDCQVSWGDVNVPLNS